ncbi:unnamed protein product [Rangifer tarandus platyrhynchus]|uniref:Uncharacterized protein n=2 Tax=Rangifer tarandus platyrhynchus TaxID=3082113 RepID=A0ABN8Z593_RANTA|nr:unnamed protein product [Rangifer tarandus platyrhynchus]
MSGALRLGTEKHKKVKAACEVGVLSTAGVSLLLGPLVDGEWLLTDPCIHVCIPVSVRLHVLKSRRSLLSSDPKRPLGAQSSVPAFPIRNSCLQRWGGICSGLFGPL